MYKYWMVILTSSILCRPLYLAAEESLDCFYKDSRGIIKIASSLDEVPQEFRDSSQCVKAKKEEFVRPNEIELAGNIRSVDIATPVGRVELRWPRNLEKVFGKTPERALVDAAKTASRALKSGGFPTEIATLDMT